MQDKMLDHLYHRTRVDAQITGNICLVAIMAILALTCGDKFEPFPLWSQLAGAGKVGLGGRNS